MGGTQALCTIPTMPANTPFLSIVIPAYNEERRLPRTLAATIAYLKAQNYSSEILIVTDGSKDKTVEVAQNFCDRFSDLRVLSFAQNRGKGFAVKEGMLAARGSYRLFMDADYAVPIEAVEACLKKLREEHLDMVLGSRSVPEAEFEQAQPFIRHMLAVAFGCLQKAVLRLPYTDTQCGFKLFTAQSAQRYFPLLTYECAYFDAELVYVSHRLGARIGEVGVRWRHDNETRLPIGPRRSLELVKKLWLIRTLHGALNPVSDPQRLAL
jgi:dolichyl-phosphate beta-glucosyltransferase